MITSAVPAGCDSDSDRPPVSDEVTSHTITTLAGTDAASGDGGQTRQAQLDEPGWIGVDGSGNVDIVDAINNRARKMTPRR